MMDFVLKRPRRSPLIAVQSTFIHAAIVCGALWATRAVAAEVSRSGPLVIDLPWHQPLPASNTPVTRVCECPVLPAPVVGSVPIGIPPIEPAAPGPIPDHPEYSGFGLAAGLVADSMPSGAPLAASIYQESDVDDLPVLVSAPAPRYPRVMAEAGIDGSVTLSFVIDSVGRVVAGSAKLIRSSHDAFVPAAEEAVYGSIFRPAKRRGEGVPVLVRQTVVFRH